MGDFVFQLPCIVYFFIWKWLKRWLWQVLQRWFWQVLLPEGYLGQGWRATFGLPGKNMPSSRRSILFSLFYHSLDKLYLTFSCFAVCWCAEKRRHCGGGLQFCSRVTIIVKISNPNIKRISNPNTKRISNPNIKGISNPNVKRISFEMSQRYPSRLWFPACSIISTHVANIGGRYTNRLLSWDLKKTSMSFHFALDLHQEAICRSFLKRPTESMPSIYVALLKLVTESKSKPIPLGTIGHYCKVQNPSIYNIHLPRLLSRFIHSIY